MIFDIASVTEAMMMQFTNTPSKAAFSMRRQSVARPGAYRIASNSISVNAPERRHSLAKKNTDTKTPSTPIHQNQLAYMPCSLTRPATNSGVSDEKLVATIEVPAINHGSERPATKKSSALRLALRANAMPIPAAASTKSATMAQSMPVITVCALSALFWQ